ncbi:uncharacterized protein N7515_007976 [Penicillium bovifimosum]|uniref:Uncharacterized protein n=1 Tax=Penicillium bovifimosum TaxID=126998 RepID=A0A9W9KXA5_9EURO|nr:uncharacterized protein N7515_007976 [Penicillium bovifimosum]KAJ5124151.1 hypothetical protein N7515_007976 [Penicillium bovifimosum]
MRLNTGARSSTSPSPESEEAQAQRLIDEARKLGLKVPEKEISPPLAASNASGVIGYSSPVLSSGSSTDRYSICGSGTPLRESASPTRSALDQVVSSLSDVTLASERIKPGSTRSLASLSTRPTSFCSSDGKTGLAGHGYHIDSFEPKLHRHSMLSVASADKKEKRRSSLKSAIGRLHFRKKRSSSSSFLPSEAPVTISPGDNGSVNVFVEPEAEPNGAANEDAPPCASIAHPPSRLEIPEAPLPSKEALQRTLDDPEMSELHERHQLEKNRHLAFQDVALSNLRRRHQTAISEQQSENQRREEWKREKNISSILQMEERQLAVEIEQQREFDRAKMNSRTRIKHMEGYLRNASPPPSPSPSQARLATRSEPERFSGSFSESESTPPPRVLTRQHMEQLEQQYHDHESMDQLHNARIKVLRDRQEVKLQEAMARMERELDEMCDRHVREIATLRSEHEREETDLMQALDQKKIAMCQRWQLEEAVLRRQLEVRHGQSYGPLPVVSFEDYTPDTDTPVAVPTESPLDMLGTGATDPNSDSVVL